jgi:hypothetical protein
MRDCCIVGRSAWNMEIRAWVMWCPSNISRKRFKNVTLFMGIVDGIQPGVDGQQQAKSSLHIQPHPWTGTIMSIEQTKIRGETCEVSTTSLRANSGGVGEESQAGWDEPAIEGIYTEINRGDVNRPDDCGPRWTIPEERWNEACGRVWWQKKTQSRLRIRS